MREYLNKKFIVETLISHPGQAFLTRELEAITEIPIKTLCRNLQHLVNEGKIQKKTLNIQSWNKKKTCKVGRAQVWYYIRSENVSGEQPPSISA